MDAPFHLGASSHGCPVIGVPPSKTNLWWNADLPKSYKLQAIQPDPHVNYSSKAVKQMIALNTKYSCFLCKVVYKYTVTETRIEISKESLETENCDHDTNIVN